MTTVTDLWPEALFPSRALVNSAPSALVLVLYCHRSAVSTGIPRAVWSANHSIGR
jgi:hypothetical protein